MVDPEEKERTAGRSGEEPNSMPATGYARLSLVRFRVWQIPLVLVILICVSFLLFPRERMLIDFHLERGRMDEALDEISNMLAKDPDNPELLRLAVETRVLLGDMDEAIRLQERAVRIGPPSPAGWRRLATLYEWNRNPRAALKAYEEAASVDPGDKEALEKVVDYSRYLGKTDEVGRAVVRLVEIDDITAEGDDPLVRELTEALNALAEERRTKDPDPLLDDLLGRLYLVRSDYLSDLGEGKTAGSEETVRNAIEGFLVAGRLEQGGALAERLDKVLQSGMTFRLAWLDYLRWNGLTQQALALVIKLQKQEPESAKLARLVAELAGQTEDIALLIRSLEGRLRLEPDSETIKAALADLYRVSGDPDRAFPLYAGLYRDHPQGGAYLNALLETAGASDDPALKERAADLSAITRPQDRDLLRRRADLYLAAENPKKAWPLLSDLAAQSRGEREAVRTMIQAAGYTNDPALLKKALKRALALRPSDRDLQREAADMFLWTDGAEASFQVLLKTARQRGATRADVFRLIELAGYTGRPELEREALALAAVRLRGPSALSFREAAPSYTVPASDSETLAAVRGYLARYPGDLAFRDLLIRLFEGSGRPGLAAPLLADISNGDPDDLQKALAAGEAFLQADQLGKGLPFLERAMALDPGNTALRRRMVTYYGWLGMRERQVAGMRRLEEQGLLEAGERIQLAEALLQRGDGASALEILESFRNADPLPRREGLLLAEAYVLTGKRDRALAVYEDLARTHRGSPSLLAELGDRALWLDRTSAALKFYEAALRLEPKNLRALKGSGQIYAWNNNPDRAMDRFEAYNRLNPDDFEVRYQLGELYFANQRKGAAFKEYDKTLRLIDRKKKALSPP